MSTEHDETKPVPATPTGASPGDPATTPIPRPGAGRTEEPTVVLDTFATEPDPARTEAIGTPRPTDDAGTTRPMPVTPGTTRTSTFAAGAGTDKGTGTGTAPAATAPSAATATEPRPADDRTAGHAPATTAPERQVSTALRVGTVVWGLVLAIIGVGVIAAAAGAQLDLELAAIGLLALAGVALIVGSVVTASRRKR